jgi:Secretion system C-terminal sorting domain
MHFSLGKDMKKQVLLFMMLFLLTTIYSQEFELMKKNTTSYFTIDRFDNKIYISPYYSALVGKYSIKTNDHIITDFPNFPVFMHNTHKAIYMEITDSSNIYYLHDFTTNVSKIIWEFKFHLGLGKTLSYFTPRFKISPNDSLVSIGSPKPIYDSVRIKSTPEFIMYGEDYPYCWGNDSTVIFKSLDYSLAEYYTYSTKIDTLLDMGEGNDIVSFDYNIKKNLLAYSVEDEFYVYDCFHHKRIFQFETNNTGWVEFKDIKWNQDETQLAFFGYDYTNPISYIYIYSLDSNKVTYIPNSDYGLKAHLEWLNNDTILYVDVAEDRLMGFNISGAFTDVKAESDTYPREYSLKQNYPNPFNPSTTISFQIPKDGFVNLIVYNLLGQVVAELVNEYQTIGKYSLKFNANNLPSGVYFYKIKSGSFSKINKMILLR